MPATVQAAAAFVVVIVAADAVAGIGAFGSTAAEYAAVETAA